MFPKVSGKKKRKKHAKSIIQPKAEKYCYLCALLNDDYSEKLVQEHHVIFGTANRTKSEEMGLKVNLCLCHHTEGPEAVHNNQRNRRILESTLQQTYEQNHSHAEWMEKIGKNYYID